MTGPRAPLGRELREQCDLLKAELVSLRKVREQWGRGGGSPSLPLPPLPYCKFCSHLSTGPSFCPSPLPKSSRDSCCIRHAVFMMHEDLPPHCLLLRSSLHALPRFAGADSETHPHLELEKHEGRRPGGDLKPRSSHPFPPPPLFVCPAPLRRSCCAWRGSCGTGRRPARGGTTPMMMPPRPPPAPPAAATALGGKALPPEAFEADSNAPACRVSLSKGGRCTFDVVRRPCRSV